MPISTTAGAQLRNDYFFEAFLEALSGFSIFCCTSAGASASAWTGLLQ